MRLCLLPTQYVEDPASWFHHSFKATRVSLFENLKFEFEIDVEIRALILINIKKKHANLLAVEWGIDSRF